jgi:hypothetical protein
MIHTQEIVIKRTSDTIKHVDVFWKVFSELARLDSEVVEHKRLQDILIQHL